MGENRRRWSASLAAIALAVLAVGGAGAPATAAAAGAWADWDPLTGTGGAYTTGIALAGAPAITAEATSDSRSGQVGVVSGASTWLSEGTPVGQKYGSSKNRPYLNLRPKADTAVAPSTTTYTFSKPTPTANWTFVIGDIDADQLQIRRSAPTASRSPPRSSASAADSTPALPERPESPRARATPPTCPGGTPPPRP